MDLFDGGGHHSRVLTETVRVVHGLDTEAHPVEAGLVDGPCLVRCHVARIRFECALPIWYEFEQLSKDPEQVRHLVG